MTCPYCNSEMKKGAMECYKTAPRFVDNETKENFSFGEVHFPNPLMNITENVWYCEEGKCREADAVIKDLRRKYGL